MKQAHVSTTEGYEGRRGIGSAGGADRGLGGRLGWAVGTEATGGEAAGRGGRGGGIESSRGVRQARMRGGWTRARGERGAGRSGWGTEEADDAPYVHPDAERGTGAESWRDGVNVL